MVDHPTLGFQHNGYSHMSNLYQICTIYQNLDNIYLDCYQVILLQSSSLFDHSDYRTQLFKIYPSSSSSGYRKQMHMVLFYMCERLSLPASTCCKRNIYMSHTYCSSWLFLMFVYIFATTCNKQTTNIIKNLVNVLI